MAKSSSEKIYDDLYELSEKYNDRLVFVLCAIALKENMGLANWRSYINMSFKDPDFQKIIAAEANLASNKK